MSLTFRSTIAELVKIVVVDSDGSRRVATLERDPDNSRRWSGSVDHPNGTRYSVDTFDPDVVAALGKLTHAFVSREDDYHQSKARGHRQPASQLRDPNRQLPVVGEFAPIVPIPSNRS